MKRGTLLAVTITVMLTAALGRIQFQGHEETWYNRPMDRITEKARKNGIEGERWDRADGCKMIGHYIMCAGAANRYGEIVETSRGLGIIVDTGEFAKANPENIDIAVTW